MSELAPVIRAARVALALVGVVAAGCAGPKHAQPQAPVVPPTAPPAVAAEAPSAPAPVTAPAVAAAPTPVPRTAAPGASPAAPTVAQVPAAAKPPRIVAPPPAAAPPAKVVPKPTPAPVAIPAPAVPLDLKSLETRLRQTKAIGVLTKLSLKNQVDDLVEMFRAYHKRQARTPLADLRRNYDMLLLKVLSLLQDSDPPLARDIVKSRAAIWSILEDPRKFTEANLMAGAMP